MPGSGKSTYAKKYLSDKPIISRDAVRFEIVKEDEEYFSHEKKVFSEFIRRIVKACQSEGCAVVDATHITKASRSKLFNALDAYMKHRYDTTFIYINTPLKTCLAQNALREGRAFVPQSAIYRMSGALTRPSQEEHDSIIEIITVGGGTF